MNSLFLLLRIFWVKSEDNVMSTKSMSLADKLDLLFATRQKQDGNRFTYEEIQSISGIRPSTISRMRSGQNSDPSFRTIAGLAEVFGVPLRYFSNDMTLDEARALLLELDTEERQVTEAERNRQQTAEKLAMLALRAAQMDASTISMLNEMIDYVIQQQSIDLEREHPAA